MRWNQAGADKAMYPDMNYNLASYGANNVSNPPYQQSVPATSTQLARRPMNRHLVQTGPRAQFDNPNDWSLTEDVVYDPNGQNGALAENDSIERLEERAQIAKRDAQSKRKQIPPFVQKLNR
jgi:heat shock transcription factor